MLIEILQTGFCIGLISSVIGVAYIGVLSREDLFNWWWRFGNRFERYWFFRPIWGCAKCFSGQFALWFYIYKTIRIVKIGVLPLFLPIPAFKIYFEGFSLIELISSVSWGLILSVIIFNILNREK